MKKTTFLALIFCTAIAFTVPGCGSGGEGGNTNTQPTQAIVYLSTQGTPSLQPINGVQVTLTLPTGVTVGADGTGNANSGVVKASGSAAGAVLAQGFYTPATSSTPGTVKVYVVKTAGFNTGEFATVTCNIANGASPTASGFGLSNFDSFSATVDPVSGTVTNVTGITGLTPTLAVDIR